MARLVDNKEVLKVIGDTVPDRQHQYTAFEVKHGGLNAWCLLNRNIFRSK